MPQEKVRAPSGRAISPTNTCALMQTIIREKNKTMNRKPLLPPFYFLVAILLMAAFHCILPVKRIIPSPFTCLGVLPILFGGWLSIWSDQLFKKTGTTVKPFEKSSTLLTHGPYRFSRHPMYLGMMVILLGIAILLGSITPFISVVVFVIVIDRAFIVMEEKMMKETFGNAYGEYKKHVRRWL